MTFGLESTRVLPNRSSRRIAPKMPDCEAAPKVRAATGDSGDTGSRDDVSICCLNSIPDPGVPAMRPQSTPLWYSCESVTSTIVASISTCRCDEAITASRYSCTRRCCMSVARIVTVPATALTATSLVTSPGSGGLA